MASKRLSVKKLDPETCAELLEYFPLERDGYLQFGETGYVLPHRFEEGLNEIHNMAVRPDDVFVVTFPRSGTTWSQELVWLINNDYDFETAKTIPLTERYSFIEFGLFNTSENIKQLREAAKTDMAKKKLLTEYEVCSMEHVVSQSTQRFIKTHLPLSILPPELLDTCKVVYVARDPRDVCVSFYHLTLLMKQMTGYTGNFRDYWNFFRRDLVMWSPFFAHVKEAWAKRNHPNLLFLFYKEMSQDLPSVIRRVAKFYGKPCNDEQIVSLCEHLKFDNFSKNKAVGLPAFEDNGLLKQGEKFIRKGKVGGWREYFDYEMSVQAQRWMQKHLQDSDLRFPDVTGDGPCVDS